jgi:hypothetical protein
MSQPMISTMADRCGQSEKDYGRCQLTAAHPGSHAAYLGGGTCITWYGEDLRYWPAYPASPWLVTLPWALGCELPTAEPHPQYSTRAVNNSRGVRSWLSRLANRNAAIYPASPNYTPLEEILGDAD